MSDLDTTEQSTTSVPVSLENQDGAVSRGERADARVNMIRETSSTETVIREAATSTSAGRGQISAQFGLARSNLVILDPVHGDVIG